MVEKCTPEQRIELIATAKAATENGNLHGCYYKLLAGESSVVEPNPLKQDMAGALGKIVYNARFSSLSLACFNNLYHKLSWYGPGYVRVILKGSTAISLQKDDCDFDFGDMDIGVYINPHLDKASFDKIYTDVSIVCGQVIAKHKQMLDRTFFRPREGHDVLLSEEDKYLFRDMHIKAMESIGVASCFSYRNESSSNSIYLTRSEAEENKVVRINMPHFENAEKIPLEYTPIMCSINDTIRNVTDNGRVTAFSLFRIKWGNCVSVAGSDSGSGETGSDKFSKLSSDFIDITLLKQDDSNLMDFWQRGGFVARSPLTCLVSKWGWRMTCSSLNECIHDLHKSLLVYDMSAEKKDKKHEMLKKLICSTAARASPLCEARQAETD